MMKGIDWAALPLIAEMLGIVDVDTFINQLITIRNFNEPEPDKSG